MNFQGRITKILPLVTGVGKESGIEWAKLEVVVEETNPRNPEYPQVLKVEFFKTEDNIKWIREEWAHEEGDEVNLVDLSFKTNEWNGKYFTSISCFKIEAINNGGGTAPSGNGASNLGHGEDNLPF